MFERRSQKLLSHRDYVRRLRRHGLIGTGIVGASLGVGVVGYHGFEALGWLDAFTNAAMILSGMGPLAQPHTVGGKIFAGVYALYSGLVLLLVVGIVAAPVVHRFLHRFHLETADDE